MVDNADKIINICKKYDGDLLRTLYANYSKPISDVIQKK
jgi:hypothetical protein